MKVHEIMTAHARCAAPDNSVVEAAGLMRELDVGVLPVCENDRIAGMITDRDIVLRAVADGRGPYETSVRDVMSPGVVWVFADQEVEDAARIMEEKQIRRLPVLNREKRLVGILSLGDVAVTSNPAFSGRALREVSETPEEHMRGGRTESSVRRDRRAAAEAEAPRGTRRIPAGARKTTGRSEKQTTRVERRAGARTERGRAGSGGQPAGGRQRRAAGGGTTRGAKGRSAGASNQGKRGGRKQAATRAGGRRRAT